MAILANEEYQGIEIDNAYIKIESVRFDANALHAKLLIYKDIESREANLVICSKEVVLSNDLMPQVYEKLKTEAYKVIKDLKDE